MPDTPKPGTIAWTDLTVPDADAIRDFYTRVTGWKAEPVSMGEYSDYVMVSSTGEGVAGICHSRGPNVNVPPQWLIYIVVADIDQAVAQCTVFGGEVLDGPRPMSGGMFCVIRDPAGAVCGLYSAPATK
ncbi:MAG TPA: VOC family protein [Vicinamibacterales bacterium]|nr:VOC family protein [Vicinamibacterales bacterium]